MECVLQDKCRIWPDAATTQVHFRQVSVEEKSFQHKLDRMIPELLPAIRGGFATYAISCHREAFEFGAVQCLRDGAKTNATEEVSRQIVILKACLATRTRTN